MTAPLYYTWGSSRPLPSTENRPLFNQIRNEKQIKARIMKLKVWLPFTRRLFC
jgi:hypothetical protein